MNKTRKALGDARIVLCTLSMLSNDRVVKSHFTELVPVETLIVDEASQVEIGDYLIPLSKFYNTLQKLIFIGDDKQCMNPVLLNQSSLTWISSGSTWT